MGRIHAKVKKSRYLLISLYLAMNIITTCKCTIKGISSLLASVQVSNASVMTIYKSLPDIGLTVPLMGKNYTNPHSADNVAMTPLLTHLELSSS